MAESLKGKEVLGLRVSRGGKFVREMELCGQLTVGGAPTDHIILDGVKKSAVLFRTGASGEAEMLLADSYRGEIGGDGEMLSFGHLKTLGLLKREGERYVLPIQRGRQGHVEADGLLFEFGYRPALAPERVTVPKTGPGFENVTRIIEPDNMNFYRTLSVTGALLIAFMIYTFYAKVEAKEFKVEDLVRRVTKLEVPEANVGVVEAPVTAEVGTGGGGGGGGAGGGVGEGIPTTGVVAAITTLGAGSGRSIADMLAAGGAGSDLDGIASGIGGLKAGMGGGGIGGGLGAGGAGGTGLGGGVGGIGGLAGGGFGPGSGGGLVKKRVAVTGSGPSSVGGEGAKFRSADVIGKYIRSHLAGIQNAYNTALKQNPNLGGGKIVVRFSIAASGTVTSASIVSSTMNCPSLENAIVSRIRGWKFPTIESGDTTIVYPFVFVSQEG